MKIAFFLFLFGTFSLFGEMIVLDNQTPYPSKNANSTVKLQWAVSSQEMEEKTVNSLYQDTVQEDPMPLTAGKNQITVPNNQKYFRVLVWTKGSPAPTYVTSWVPITSGKTYILNEKDLYFSVLNAGSGC